MHHPRWKAGVPRDAGSGWDFEDVRDHYLALLFGVDPAELRRVDHERYLELSRAVSGEVMAEVFGEWRRAASPCGGGLVLWLRDLLPGRRAGALLDHRGEPKVAYHHLRRALAPVAVWSTDEGLGGVAAHVANDGPRALAVRAARRALPRLRAARRRGAEELVELAPHSVRHWTSRRSSAVSSMHRWAYRFGPPQHDLVVVSLERDEHEDPILISQSVRFPAGRPTVRESADRLGLLASACQMDDETVRLSVKARRLAYGVRIHAPGFVPDDDAFSIEPGKERVVRLRARKVGAEFSEAAVTALNLEGRLRVATAEAFA